MTQGLVDASDLYRSSLVQAVAALDSYVHGVVLDRAVDLLMGRMQATTKDAKVGLNFSAVQEIVSAALPADREIAARRHISQRLALETFQKPDDVAKAFSMVGVGKIWSTAFPGGPSNASTALSLVVRRRNRIVHQCDSDPLAPGQVTPLSDQDALDSVATVEMTVATIDSIL
ncbi:hypothetical protein [Amycolatopsis sp. lyj-84]|uniref:hypothetical protein n=1 Tax=Amycolatopsis sp. lyj-84 TaxID=2789284 RepID=UPI00397BE127